MNSFEPHITVATVVEQEGTFLLVNEQIGGEQVLNQPAGHVEAGETLVQAACRETLEETAWRVEVTDLLGVYVYQPRLKAGVYYRFCFIARPLSHDPHQRLDHGIIEALWLDRATIASQGSRLRSPLVARCIDDYLAGQRLPLDSIYQHPWPLQNA